MNNTATEYGTLTVWMQILIPETMDTHAPRPMTDRQRYPRKILWKHYGVSLPEAQRLFNEFKRMNNQIAASAVRGVWAVAPVELD